MHPIFPFSVNILFLFFSVGPPKVTLSFGPSYAEKNKNVTFPKCHVTSFPPAVIMWSKVLGELAQARAVYKDGQRSVVNAQKKDSGLYKCTAANKQGQDSGVTQLNVVELPFFTVSPPLKLETSTVQNISVPCQAAGDPLPKVTWMKENGELPTKRSKVSKDGTLYIWNTVEKDSGKYTCVASSNEVITKAASNMNLIVKRGKKLF